MYRAPPIPQPRGIVQDVDYTNNGYETNAAFSDGMPVHDEGIPLVHQLHEALETFLDRLRAEEANYAGEEDQEDMLSCMVAEGQAEVRLAEAITLIGCT